MSTILSLSHSYLILQYYTMKNSNTQKQNKNEPHIPGRTYHHLLTHKFNPQIVNIMQNLTHPYSLSHSLALC